MDLILIPGFWLGGDSWNDVVGPLRDAGHTVRPLTLPGLESRDADRSGITFQDHVDAVLATLDTLDAPAVLVGHSGGGPIAYGALDHRPEKVSRVIYVDSGPLAEGHSVNDELTIVDDEIPLPDWSAFLDEDLVDLTDELRYQVPATVICCEFTAEQLREWMKGGFASELLSTSDYELVELPTGHWPQFTKPAELASTILKAIDRV